MLRRIIFLFCCTLVVGYAASEESTYGVTVPLTVGGNLLYTNAKQTDEGLRSAASAGFRALISPSISIGSHWFLYSAFDIQSASYFTGTGYTDDAPPVRARVVQAFAGYSGKLGNLSFLGKAGQLSSAFGLAPVEYDDSKMALPTPPLLYLSNIQFQTDEIPSGTRDLLYEDDYGHAPVTLFGLPGIETEISLGRVDGRFQITNSSPSNPQSLLSRSQSAQWAVGAGYTVPGGLHVGASAFRGAYLDADVQEYLPPGVHFRDFKDSGIGIDAQWFRGSWSAEGEWQRFRFRVPGFLQSPVAAGAYAQMKKIVSTYLHRYALELRKLRTDRRRALRQCSPSTAADQEHRTRHGIPAQPQAANQGRVFPFRFRLHHPVRTGSLAGYLSASASHGCNGPLTNVSVKGRTGGDRNQRGCPAESRIE